MSEYQLYLIAFLASIVVFLLNKLYQTTGKKVKDAYLTVGVYVISFTLAVAWKGFVVPALPVCVATDPGACVNAWLNTVSNVLQLVGGYVAFAALIYQAFLKSVLDKYAPAAWNSVFKKPSAG